MYRPNSTWTWAFVATTTVQGAIVLAFESYVFALFQTSLKGDAKTSSSEQTIPTFLTLYIFGFLYELCLVYDALRLKNTIQIIGLCMYNLALLIYAAIQMTQINDAVNQLENSDKGPLIDPTVWSAVKPFLVAIPCIIAFGTISMSFVARKLYDEFAWTIYKHISADLRMKRRYLTYQIYIALLKFDFFFFIGFTIQFIVIVAQHGSVEFYLTIAAIPVTIIILLMGGFFTRRESKLGMIAIILLYIAGLAYFIFKLVRMYEPIRSLQYKDVRKSLTTFAVLAIVLILLTIINAVMCTVNFAQGLKPYIASRKVESEDEKPSMMEMPDIPSQNKYGAPVPSRMTID